MSLSKIEDDLTSELGISALQAKTYLLVTCGGMMTPDEIASRLGVPASEALDSAESLVELGAFIDMPGARFEAMHPRFTAVNMLRRVCARHGRPFGRNKVVDAVGAALEEPYDSARTK